MRLRPRPSQTVGCECQTWSTPPRCETASGPPALALLPAESPQLQPVCGMAVHLTTQLDDTGTNSDGPRLYEHARESQLGHADNGCTCADRASALAAEQATNARMPGPQLV